MKRTMRGIVLLASAGVVLQFGGCVAGALSDLFFAVGPFLL